MSRTKRRIRKWDNNTTIITEGGDAQVSRNWWGRRKMLPYAISPNVSKSRASKTDHVGGFSKGVSRYEKLITKNANRALKKAFRQKQKLEILKAINEV